VSLLTPSHLFFPSGLISLQYHHEFLEKKRTYTNDQSKHRNISSGKIS
jgi:hypothetical protein